MTLRNSTYAEPSVEDPEETLAEPETLHLQGTVEPSGRRTCSGCCPEVKNRFDSKP